MSKKQEQEFPFHIKRGDIMTGEMARVYLRTPFVSTKDMGAGVCLVDPSDTVYTGVMKALDALRSEGRVPEADGVTSMLSGRHQFRVGRRVIEGGTPLDRVATTQQMEDGLYRVAEIEVVTVQGGGLRRSYLRD